MKVITGTARGRTLLAPKGGRLRITSDRVKEALFNILGPLEGMAFLDLFAGSGNVGIEALSRGAGKVLFVERDVKHLATVEQNLQRCCFVSGFETMGLSFDHALSRLRERQEQFEVIFADPPYEKGMVKLTLDALLHSPVHTSDGVIVVEHSVREACEGNEGFMVSDRRRYGDTALTFLRSN